MTDGLVGVKEWCKNREDELLKELKITRSHPYFKDILDAHEKGLDIGMWFCTKCGDSVEKCFECRREFVDEATRQFCDECLDKRVADERKKIFKQINKRIDEMSVDNKDWLKRGLIAYDVYTYHEIKGMLEREELKSKGDEN